MKFEMPRLWGRRQSVDEQALEAARRALTHGNPSAAIGFAREGLHRQAAEGRGPDQMTLALRGVLLDASTGMDPVELVPQLRQQYEDTIRVDAAQSWRPFWAMVSVLDGLGRTEESVAALESELHRWDVVNDAHPRAEELRAALARRYWDAGRRGDALSFWRRTHTLADSTPSVLTTSAAQARVIADALRQMGRDQEADVWDRSMIGLARRGEWPTLAQLCPSNVREQILVAVARSHDGHHREALAELERLCALLADGDDRLAHLDARRCRVETLARSGALPQARAAVRGLIAEIIDACGVTSPRAVGVRMLAAGFEKLAGADEAAALLWRDILADSEQTLLTSPDGHKLVAEARRLIIGQGLALPTRQSLPAEQGFQVLRARPWHSVHEHRPDSAFLERLWLGDALLQEGRVEDAIRAYATARSSVVANPAEQAFGIIETANRLGLATEEAGRLSDAVDIYREGMDQAEATLGRHHPTTLTLRANLADALEHVGAVDDAAWYWGINALAPAERLRPGSNDVVRLGWIAFHTERPEVARRLARRALREKELESPPHDLALLSAYAFGLAVARRDMDVDERLQLCERALGHVRTTPVTERNRILRRSVRSEAALCLDSAGRHDDAVAVLTLAEQEVQEHDEVDVDQLGKLAAAWVELGESARAIELMVPGASQDTISTVLVTSNLDPDEMALAADREFLASRLEELASAEAVMPQDERLERHLHLADHAAENLSISEYQRAMVTLALVSALERAGQWDPALGHLLNALDVAEEHAEWTSVGGVLLVARTLWHLRHRGHLDQWTSLLLRDARQTIAERGIGDEMSVDCLRRLIFGLELVGEHSRAANLQRHLTNVHSDAKRS